MSASCSSAEENQLVLAMDVGGSGIKAELFDRQMVSHRQWALPMPTAEPACGQRSTTAIIEHGQTLLADMSVQQREMVVALGLAIPGVVDATAGIARLSANLGWREVPLRRLVQRHLDVPVVLHHDVTAAGEAEFHHGAGRGVSNLLVAVIGTGIAATIISEGTVLRGGPRQAGELGHIIVRPDGPECACGQRGCLETVASAGAIVRRYREATGTVVDGAAEVLHRRESDPAAQRVWSQAVDALADGLVTACTLLAPDRIVLGGGLAAAGAELLEPTAKLIGQRAKVAAAPPLVAAHLGARAGVVGAGLRAWATEPEGHASSPAVSR